MPKGIPEENSRKEIPRRIPDGSSRTKFPRRIPEEILPRRIPDGISRTKFPRRTPEDNSRRCRKQFPTAICHERDLSKGLRGRNSPNCTLSQNGYGENAVPEIALSTPVPDKNSRRKFTGRNRDGNSRQRAPHGQRSHSSVG